MSVERGAGDGYYERTMTGNSTSVFSYCMWVYITTDRNDYCGFLGLHDSNHLLGVSSNGTTLILTNSSVSNVLTGPNMTVGTWYFVGVTKNGTGAGTTVMYWAEHAVDTALSSGSGNFLNLATNPPLDLLGWVNYGSDRGWFGRLYSVRYWDGAALSGAEMLAEYESLDTPARTSSLYGHWLKTNTTTDLSGNGNSLTGGSGLADAADPEATGGTTHEETYAGSTTPTGALAKVTNKPLAGSATPSGAVARQTNKSTSGATTPTGGLSKQVEKSLAGATAPSGALANALLKALALAGSTTPAGTLSLEAELSLVGSTTPTGALIREIEQYLAGQTTPTGVLARQVELSLVGTTTPTGALVTALLKVLALAGSTTPTGALVRAVDKVLVGATAPTSSLSRTVTKSLAGATVPTGGLTKLVDKFVVAAVTAAGTLANVVIGGTIVTEPPSVGRASASGERGYGSTRSARGRAIASETARGRASHGP